MWKSLEVQGRQGKTRQQGGVEELPPRNFVSTGCFFDVIGVEIKMWKVEDYVDASASERLLMRSLTMLAISGLSRISVLILLMELMTVVWC